MTTSVAVIGGSIAGCAAALALHRTAECEVTLFERNAGGLKDRGVGLGIRNDLYRELNQMGLLDSSVPFVQLRRRKWVTRDGDSPHGHLAGIHDFPFRAYNWGSLWHSLRNRIPASVDYRAGAKVISVVDSYHNVVVTSNDDVAAEFDAALGADGYGSITRAAMFPAVTPHYAGYLLWRGVLPASEIPDHDGLWAEDEAVMSAFPGGHMITFLIPAEGGGQVLNWALYCVPPAGVTLRLDDPDGAPQGADRAALLDHLRAVTELMPRYWQEMLRRMPDDESFVRPVYDMYVPAVTAGRLALIGDAAAVARPHTGGGATKAMQDVATLRSILGDGTDWPAAFRAYDNQRGPVNRSIVELGRALGSATVTDPPNWREMTQTRFTEWWATLTAQVAIGGTSATTR